MACGIVPGPVANDLELVARMIRDEMDRVQFLPFLGPRRNRGNEMNARIRAVRGGRIDRRLTDRESPRARIVRSSLRSSLRS